MFRKCTNPKCITNNKYSECACEKCLAPNPKSDNTNYAFETLHEPLQEENAIVAVKEAYSMFGKCTNPRCVKNNKYVNSRCEKCLGFTTELDIANYALETLHEPLQGEKAIVAVKEIKPISSHLYPDFRLSGKFDGGMCAARWLQRLRYDFLCAGILDPSPSHIIMAIDMLAQDRVAVFLDSTYRELCDKSNHSSTDLETLESALKNAFPRMEERAG